MSTEHKICNVVGLVMQATASRVGFTIKLSAAHRPLTTVTEEYWTRMIGHHLLSSTLPMVVTPSKCGECLSLWTSPDDTPKACTKAKSVTGIVVVTTRVGETEAMENMRGRRQQGVGRKTTSQEPVIFNMILGLHRGRISVRCRRRSQTGLGVSPNMV
jgi:hypothetical protein